VYYDIDAVDRKRFAIAVMHFASAVMHFASVSSLQAS